MIEDADKFLAELGLEELLANFKLRVIGEMHDLFWLNKNEPTVQAALRDIKAFEQGREIESESFSIIDEFLVRIKDHKFSIKQFDECRENLSLYYRLATEIHGKNITHQKVQEGPLPREEAIQKAAELCDRIKEDLKLLEKTLEGPMKKMAGKVIMLMEETITPFDTNMLDNYLGKKDEEIPVLLIKKDSASHKNIEKLLRLYLAVEDEIKLERIADLTPLESMLKNINEKGQEYVRLPELHVSLTYLIHASNSLLANYIRSLTLKESIIIKKWDERMKNLNQAIL